MSDILIPSEVIDIPEKLVIIVLCLQLFFLLSVEVPILHAMCIKNRKKLNHVLPALASQFELTCEVSLSILRLKFNPHDCDLTENSKLYFQHGGN